jgi:hypothetical protein
VSNPDLRTYSPFLNRIAAVVVVGLLLLAPSCGSGSGGGSSGGSGSTPGTVTGTALDTQGHPLSGAAIDVCSSVFYNSCMTATTAADGSYAVRLTPTDSWNATGSITRSYNAATYCLPLAIDNPNTFSSAEASIRNFRWKLSGLIPGQIANTYASSYFGASLNVVYTSNVNYDTKLVRVDLVPSGALVDGSTGSASHANVGDWASNVVGNIPLGRYDVSATYLPPGGSPMPIGISLTSMGTPLTSVTVDFPPDSGGSCIIQPEATVYVTGP